MEASGTAQLESSAPGPGRALLLGGAQALWVQGDLQAGRDWFDAAYRDAEVRGDSTALALAAVGLGGLWIHERRGMAASVLTESRLRQALQAVDQNSSLGLRIRARLAGEADYNSGGHSRILAVLQDARAARHEDPVAWTEAVSLAHHCVLGPDHGPLRRRLAQEMIAGSFRTGRRSDLMMGMLWRTIDLFLDADPHAERGLAELEAWLVQEDHLAVGYVTQAIGVMRTIRAGRLDEAELLAAACHRRGQLAGDIDATGWYGGQLVCIRWFQGRIDESLAMLAELVKSPELSAVDSSFDAALAVAAATAGDLRQAAGALARLREADAAGRPRSSSWLVARYGMVEAAYLLGDAVAAASIYAQLEPYSGLPMLASLGVACFGSVHHALGVASLTTGDLDRAIDHLRAAIQDNTRLGHWPAVVLSRYRLAQALDRRAAPGDRAQAGPQLATARREADALGIRLPSDPEPVTCAPGHQVAGMRRRGNRWQVELCGRVAIVSNNVGMGYLATLLANPGYEISAVELVTGPGVPSAAVTESRGGPGQPVLDEAARRAYRRRLSDLDAEVRELEEMNDIARAENKRAERSWLIDQLAAATGLAGNVRHFAGSEERARISVGKAIRRALKRIEEADPVIYAALRMCVHTGLRCCYRPQ